MEVLFWYLIGVLILGVSNYIYMAYINRKETLLESKKLIVYKSFKVGLTSWIGIVLIFAFIMTGVIIYIDDWIEDKIN